MGEFQGTETFLMPDDKLVWFFSERPPEQRGFTTHESEDMFELFTWLQSRPTTSPVSHASQCACNIAVSVCVCACT